MSKSKNWKLLKIDRKTKMVAGGNMSRKSGFREGVKTYSFRYISSKKEGVVDLFPTIKGHAA